MKHVYGRKGARRVYIHHEGKTIYGGTHATKATALYAVKDIKESLGIADQPSPIEKRLCALPMGKRTLFKADVGQTLTLRRSIVRCLKKLNIEALICSSKQGVFVTRSE